MRVERKRRSGLPMMGVGCIVGVIACLVITGVGVLLLAPALPGIALQLFGGFAPTGNTDALFAATSAPPVEVQNATVPEQVEIVAGDYGSQTINPADVSADILVGSSDTGAPLATVSFGEADLFALCQQRSSVCTGSNPQFRANRFDLRPGGLVIYGEALVPQFNIWQPLGVVMQIEGARQFRVVGIDIDGTLYNAPPDANTQQQIQEVERVGNDVLNQLALNSGGSQFTLSEVYADDTNITLVLR